MELFYFLIFIFFSNHLRNRCLILIRKQKFRFLKIRDDILLFSIPITSFFIFQKKKKIFTFFLHCVKYFFSACCVAYFFLNFYFSETFKLKHNVVSVKKIFSIFSYIIHLMSKSKFKVNIYRNTIHQALTSVHPSLTCNKGFLA
jgi:hypothetical protein